MHLQARILDEMAIRTAPPLGLVLLTLSEQKIVKIWK